MGKSIAGVNDDLAKHRFAHIIILFAEGKKHEAFNVFKELDVRSQFIFFQATGIAMVLDDVEATGLTHESAIEISKYIISNL